MKTHASRNVILAFLLGVIVTSLFWWYSTAALRKQNAQLIRDREWAVQRGVRNEALLILCRQGVKE